MGTGRSWSAAMGDAVREFYRREPPRAHFRTSPHTSPSFAAAVATLAARTGLTAVIDVGAGDGTLLAGLAGLAPALTLTGIDLRARPEGLPDGIGWRTAMPEEMDGLVVANEFLDTVGVDVVVDGRVVWVDDNGAEYPGPAADEPAVRWVEKWWPAHPAHRTEIGILRDEAWSDLVRRIGHGVAVAIDYGHQRGFRPSRTTITGYRSGRMVFPAPDGRCDITAGVAVDSCLAAGESVSEMPGILLRQRDALRALGVSGAVPEIGTPDYARRLARAGADAELLDPAGLGDFYGIVQPVGVDIEQVFSGTSRRSATTGRHRPGRAE